MPFAIETFTLTEQHLKLIQRMNVVWYYSEAGAPGVDPKRPYGNGDVESDMAEILGVSYDPEKDDAATKAQALAFKELHAETALQIVLEASTFEPGVFQREHYVGKWTRKV